MPLNIYEEEKSPCIDCKHRGRDKNDPGCIDCLERLEYIGLTDFNSKKENGGGLDG